jgi:hypothetical protein
MAQETKTEWETVHQPFELNYHQHPNMRWNAKIWDEQWQKVFSEFMELTPSHFTNEDTLLDLGCGSRPALDWFNGGTSHHLDPLLNDFLKIEKMKPYWQEKTFVYSQPAEVMINHLVGKCDYTHCWNVLDHSYDWRQIMENIVSYTKNGGLVLMGTDLHSTPHEGHPGIDSKQDFFDFIDEHFEVVKREDYYHHREVALKLVKR